MSITAINETYTPYRSQSIQESTRVSAGAAVVESKTEEPTKPDGLSINNLEQLFGFQPKVNGVISIDELREHGTRQLQELSREMRTLFRENGIDTSSPIELGSQYGTGETIVKNDHPDKEKIEQLLRENPELSNDFKRISGMLELAELSEQASEFHKAYSQDPKQAVAQYAHLFNTQLTSSVLLDDGGAEIRFERIPKPTASSIMGYETSTPSGLAIETEI